MEPIAYDTKEFVLKELDILISFNALPEDFHTVVKFLERSPIPLNLIVTETVSLPEAGRALDQWNRIPAEITKIR